MSEHTPGPWHVSSKASTVIFASERLIASAGGYTSNTEQESVVSENEANARLIAAAPDLLAACVAAIDSGIASHNHWDDTQRHGDGCPLCIRQREAAAKLRAAIAKAKGEPA